MPLTIEALFLCDISWFNAASSEISKRSTNFQKIQYHDRLPPKNWKYLATIDYVSTSEVVKKDIEV